MPEYVIIWRWKPGSMTIYVPKLSNNRQPYTVHLAYAKRWKTKDAAERYLSLKDPNWAKRCEIKEVSNVNKM